MARQSKRQVRKRLPALCYKKSKDWWYSTIPDPSHPRGRREHLWSRDPDEAEALYHENITRIVAEYAERSPTIDGGPALLTAASQWTVTDLGQQYFLAKQDDARSPATLGNITKYLPRFMKWLMEVGFDPAMCTAAELTTSHLAAFRRSLAEDREISRRTANHYIEQVRGMLRWGRDTHDIRVPALGGIKKFPQKAKADHGRRQSREPLTVAQIHKLLKVADPVDKALVLLGINCGFGNMDIGTLKLADVDLEKGLISNRRQKTDVGRDFHLWPETIKALQVYQDSHRGKPKDEGVAELFFVSKQGRPMCWERVDENGKRHRSDAVKNRFDNMCKRARVKLPYGAGFYILRHTYATMLGESSTDPREVQAAMAHATLNQQDVYRHDRASKAQAAQSRLREVVFKPRKRRRKRSSASSA